MEIVGVTLNGSLIASEENLFTTAIDASNHVTAATISGGYESSAINYNEGLTTENINWHPDPLSLAWQPTNPDQTPQSWEAAINNAITEGQATEYGRTYLRETDKKLA